MGSSFSDCGLSDRRSKGFHGRFDPDRRFGAGKGDRGRKNCTGGEHCPDPNCFAKLPALQKAESFVSRRIVKTRDAFDVRLLLEAGAVLGTTLEGHLNDLVLWRELDAERINERIEQITPNLCRAELKSVLPEEVCAKLESEEFDSLRAAVKSLFAEWL